MKKRDFLKKTSVWTVATVAAVNAPYVKAQSKTPIKWRLQTYAGGPLAEHVIKPSIDPSTRSPMARWLSSCIRPTSWCRRASCSERCKKGTIDAVQSDDDSIAAPVDVSVFGGYFPFASRYSLDVPVLFNQYGLKEIWEEAYGEVEGVTWLSAGAWDPCHFNTVNPIRSLKDLDGIRCLPFPQPGSSCRALASSP